MSFKDRIKAVRKPLTQEVFAEKLGVHINTVRKWEKGQVPSGTQLKKIHIVHQDKLVDLNHLLTGVGEAFIYKGIEGGGQEAQDKEGLFGKTRHVQVEGADFAVTTHEPKTETTETRATATLVEILYLKERQLSEQTTEIKNLKAKCEAFEKKNDDLEKRISTIEEKLHPREDPAGSPAEDLGEKKAV